MILKKTVLNVIRAIIFFLSFPVALFLFFTTDLNKRFFWVKYKALKIIPENYFIN
jgi:hypothetical protein